LLPLYQAITIVQIEDGKTTLFWTDVWNWDDALAERFPRLYSHCTRKDDTVQQAIASNLQGASVNRLSPHAQQELQLLIGLIQQTTLSALPDKRLSPLSRSPDKLDTSTIYKLLKARGQPNDPASTFIWKKAAPPRVQLFIWLLSKGGIQCRSNLFRKRVVDSPNCLVCGAPDESPEHIIFNCPIAVQFWNALGKQAPQNNHTNQLHCIEKLPNCPDEQYSAFISLCCWQLWKRRNGVVFRNEHQSLRNLLLSCKAEAANWKAKMPKKSKKVTESWCILFDLLVNNGSDVI
jgi:hypothetical protein